MCINTGEHLKCVYVLTTLLQTNYLDFFVYDNLCFVIVTEVAEIGWIYYICCLFPPTFSIFRFLEGNILKENILRNVLSLEVNCKLSVVKEVYIIV